jgi:hypothetical protein
VKAWSSNAVGDTCGALYPFSANQTFDDCELFHAPCNQSELYNAMVAPLTVGPMRVSAFIWFQGENDVLEGGADPFFDFYACQLGSMIQDMRYKLDSPAAHWTTVQLAPYTGGSLLGPFRDMQCNTTSLLPNTSCAVIADGGDPLSPLGSVHSRNKQLVGRRVATGVLNAWYDNIASIGPTYDSAELSQSGSTWLANVSFTLPTVQGGLTYVPPHVNPWQNSSRCPTEIGITLDDCGWISIIGSDMKVYNATSVSTDASNTILQIVVENAPAGVTPIGTQNGYNAWPVVNWYSAVGLPVAPWRRFV